MASSPTTFFLLIFIFASTPVFAQQGCDISIVGAGIGGVYTAWRLAVDAAVVPAQKICIFEAKGRPGGRILSVDDPIPGFDGYTVDLGAYRFHRSIHHHIRQLTEIALKIDTLCYTDPLQRGDEPCGAEVRNIIAARGSIFGTTNGRDAGDKFSRYTDRIPYNIPPQYHWGPGTSFEKPRDPYDFLFGPDSIIKELGERWDELTSETDYERAMVIADEIIVAMRNGTFRGIPYSDISHLDAAVKAGLTREERALYFDTAWSAGEQFLTRISLLRQGQLYTRFFALLSEPIGLKAMVTPAEMRDGVLRRSGMRTMIDKMLQQSIQAGVRVFFNRKVSSVRRAESKPLRIGFFDGGFVLTKKVFLNIGKPDLIALGLESEPMRSGSVEFRRSVERMFVRGLLISYLVGDDTGTGSGIYLHAFNQVAYTPLTNADNPQRLIPGQMSKSEEVYFNDVLSQVRKVHRSSVEAVGLDVREAIPAPVGCVAADWLDVGAHVEIGQPRGDIMSLQRFTKPVADLDISLVNEAWGQSGAWAESSLNSAERALYHEYGVEKPEWMDDAFHNSVIKRFNV